MSQGFGTQETGEMMKYEGLIPSHRSALAGGQARGLARI